MSKKIHLTISFDEFVILQALVESARGTVVNNYPVLESLSDYLNEKESQLTEKGK